MKSLLKNNYYDGKHLSTESFKTEQAYNSDKLAQISQLIFGKGIICGLNVSAVQHYHDAVEIASGAAIDDDGQFIRVYDKIILPIRAIDGFKAHQKTHILRAVYKESLENSDIISEQCVFTYSEIKGVELAEITFENGKIDNIRDLRKSANSQFLNNFARKTVLVLERNIDEKINAAINKSLPELQEKLNAVSAGKGAEETLLKTIENASFLYNAQKKEIENILNRLEKIENGQLN